MTSGSDTIRANFVLPRALKEEAQQAAREEGMTLAEFVRGSIAARLQEVQARKFERKMVEAYTGLAEENRELAREFESVDLEGWQDGDSL